MLKKITILVIGFTIIFGLPTLSLAGATVSSCPDTKAVTFSGLVPVCNTITDTNGGFCDPCDFNVLLSGVNKLINFVLITLATPIFVLIIIYVAWLYLSDMGSAENVTKAKKILKNAIIGYIIALAAWLIVKTILSTLGFNPKDAFLTL